jgi:hypothetical protein
MRGVIASQTMPCRLTVAIPVRLFGGRGLSFWLLASSFPLHPNEWVA